MWQLSRKTFDDVRNTLSYVFIVYIHNFNQNPTIFQEKQEPGACSHVPGARHHETGSFTKNQVAGTK